MISLLSTGDTKHGCSFYNKSMTMRHQCYPPSTGFLSVSGLILRFYCYILCLHFLHACLEFLSLSSVRLIVGVKTGVFELEERISSCTTSQSSSLLQILCSSPQHIPAHRLCLCSLSRFLPSSELLSFCLLLLCLLESQSFQYPSASPMQFNFQVPGSHSAHDPHHQFSCCQHASTSVFSIHPNMTSLTNMHLCFSNYIINAGCVFLFLKGDDTTIFGQTLAFSFPSQRATSNQSDYLRYPRHKN